LGWGIGVAFQGKGLAHEALDAALGWCDRVLLAPRTVCMIDPPHAPSLKLDGRVGFRACAEGTCHDRAVVFLERSRVAPH
jgi:RimJ/RimL family protein N-acetyltransferase